MTKDEYVKTLEKVAADNAVNAKHDDYYDGYFEGLKKAIKLTKELDEPKKVVIPQFVADWIENARIYYGDEVNLLGIVYWIHNYCADIELHYEWLKNIDNQKLLLNAIVNGYEVEKEPKYKVRIKGFNGLDCTKYVNYHMPDNIFILNDRIQTNKIKTSFTKQWLKDNWSEYEAYNNAGLLEFEEVGD